MTMYCLILAFIPIAISHSLLIGIEFLVFEVVWAEVTGVGVLSGMGVSGAGVLVW